jgi:hypothetical protein
MIRRLFQWWLVASAAWIALMYGAAALSDVTMPAAYIWGVPAAVFLLGAAIVWTVRIDTSA